MLQINNDLLLLTFDFYGNIYQQNFNLRDQGKVLLVNTLKVPDNLKGKNKTSFGIQDLQNHTLLISYKNGNSFLCQLQEMANKSYVIRSTTLLILDSAIVKLKLELNLLCNPQVVSHQKDSLFFTALMLKQSHISN